MDAAVDYVTNVLDHCVSFIPIPPGKTHTPSMGIHIQRPSLHTITAQQSHGPLTAWRPNSTSNFTLQLTHFSETSAHCWVKSNS